MAESTHPILKKYPSARQLESAINGYFENCVQREQPCTPSGLALALDMRTIGLNDPDLPLGHRKLLDRALQRIEADTVELALTSKAASKGVDVVLQHTGAPSPVRGLSTLSDEELNERLARLLKRVHDYTDHDTAGKDT